MTGLFLWKLKDLLFFLFCRLRKPIRFLFSSTQWGESPRNREFFFLKRIAGIISCRWILIGIINTSKKENRKTCCFCGFGKPLKSGLNICVTERTRFLPAVIVSMVK